MAVTIKPIDTEDLWERFIAEYCPTALFQSWLWGEVEKKRGGNVWRFGCFNGKELIGIFQVLKVSAKRGTFLHIRHGPVLATQSKGTWQSIVSFLKDFAQKENAWFVRISPQIDDSLDNKKMLTSLGMRTAAIHAMDGERSWVLDLEKSENELLSDMRKTTRYEIRKAQKLGVKVTISTRTEDLKHFHVLYEETSRRQGFVQHRGIDEEFVLWSKTGNAVLLLAQYQGKTLAASIILFYGPQAIYHHSASIPSHVPASHLLQWQAILEAKKRGKKVYNFWGIAPEDNPNHPWRGITLFKKGFGGREVDFIHAHDLPLSRWYAVSRIIETARKTLKRY